ncbi:hypothetical protein Q3G72_005946 [Acer saccharum]|nr:hypothetical protein Q3G72_005946 [Acer saccharum]
MRSSGKLAEFLAVCRRQEVVAAVLVADNNTTINSSSLTDLGFEVCGSIVVFHFQLGVNSIPTLTHLAPLSIFADVVDLGAMGVVMVEDVVIFTNH